LPCAAASAIKTIVAPGALPGDDLAEIAPERSLRLLPKIFDWKRVSNPRHAS
jgi:hypothetical protein